MLTGCKNRETLSILFLTGNAPYCRARVVNVQRLLWRIELFIGHFGAHRSQVTSCLCGVNNVMLFVGVGVGELNNNTFFFVRIIRGRRPQAYFSGLGKV